MQNEFVFRFYRGNRSWNRCRAFAIPNNDTVGAIRINLRGRDRHGMVEPGIRTVDIREPAVLRAGNAGGLTIRANGKSMGSLGPHGAIRDVEFKNGEFKLVPVK